MGILEGVAKTTAVVSLNYIYNINIEIGGRMEILGAVRIESSCLIELYLLFLAQFSFYDRITEGLMFYNYVNPGGQICS